jgi:hypothetical protein
MSMDDESNLHDLEDYSSENNHDQLPAVDEVKMSMSSGSGGGKSSIVKRYMIIGLGFILLFMAIAIPLSKRQGGKVKSVEKALNKLALNGKKDFKNSTSYQSISRRWLLDDPLVEDYTQEELQQRYAMYCLHHATTPSKWTTATGWKRKGVPECEWYGVTCPPDTNKVTRIELRSNGLKGAIPPEVSLLPHLQVLNVNANDLAGQVPNEICERKWDVKVDCDKLTCQCCTNCESKRD